MSDTNASPACSSIEEVDERYHDLLYMGMPQARFLDSFFDEHDIRSVLELGFFQGKSTAFMAATMERRGGEGNIVSMDLEMAHRREPSIDEVLGDLGLSHRVRPVYAHRSFTWELHRLLESGSEPPFDFCYIDGAHTWDGTGFSFLLVDLLLKPGGWVIFDDLEWSIAGSRAAAKDDRMYAAYDQEEREAKQVRKVWELLVPARGYVNIREERKFKWGVAQKPPA